MMISRTLVGVTVAALGLVATLANIGFAANDPRALDARDDDIGRPPALMLGQPAAPIPAVADAPYRGNPLWGIPLDTLHATRERPLFSPSRRPPMPAVVPPKIEPVQTVAAPVEPEQPPLNLLGVVIGAADGYAVFINTTTHDIIRLRTGEGHDGWILQSVSGREAVLAKNQRTVVVALPQAAGDKK